MEVTICASEYTGRRRDDENNKNEERFAKVDKQRFGITEVS